MNQQDVEKWIAQNGGDKRIQYSRSTQKVANPAKQLTRPDGTDNPDYDPTAPSTIDISEEKWTAVDAEGKPTGAVLHARRRPDGDFDVVDQSDPNPTRGNTEDTPEKKNAAELQRQREKNAALPPDQDPAYETDADRRQRGDARIKQQGSDAEAERQRGRQTEADARAREDQESQRRREAAVEAEKNRPKPQQAPDGSWGYFDTTKNPPVWAPIAGPGAAAPKPVQVNGQWGMWQPSASDPKQPPTFVTIDVPKPGVTLKNVDTWEPDFAQPDLGVGKWSAAQRGKIGLPAEQGGITQDDYDNAVKEALGRGSTAITNVTNATSTVRQQQQDQERLRNTRSDEAASDFSSALGAFSTLTSRGGFDPDSGSLKNVIPGLLWEMNKNREERTAKTPQLPGLHPLFQIAAASNAATAKPPAATEQAAGTGPTPAPYQPPGAPAQPAALGLGAVPGSITPNAAPAAPVPPVGAPAPAPSVAAPAMAAPPVQSASIAPPMPSAVPTTSAPLPGPAEGLPAPGTPAPPAQLAPWPAAGAPPAAPTIPGALPGASPVPSDLPAGGTLPITPPTDPTVTDQNYQQPQYPPYTYNINQGANPYPQQDQGDMQKVSMGEGPLSSFASSALGSDQAPQPQQGEGGGGPLDSLMRSAAGGGFDPFDAAARLVSMGTPREVVAQALAQSGMLHRGRAA